jgi:hypothetical protein
MRKKEKKFFSDWLNILSSSVMTSDFALQAIDAEKECLVRPPKANAIKLVASVAEAPAKNKLDSFPLAKILRPDLIFANEARVKRVRATDCVIGPWL